MLSLFRKIVILLNYLLPGLKDEVLRAEEELLKKAQFFSERRRQKASRLSLRGSLGSSASSAQGRGSLSSSPASGGASEPPGRGSLSSSTASGGAREPPFPGYSAEAAASLSLLLSSLPPSSVACKNCNKRLRPGETCGKCFPAFCDKNKSKKLSKKKLAKAQDLKQDAKPSKVSVESPACSFSVKQDGKNHAGQSSSAVASCGVCRKDLPENGVCQGCFPLATGRKKCKAAKKNCAKKL